MDDWIAVDLVAMNSGVSVGQVAVFKSTKRTFWSLNLLDLQKSAESDVLLRIQRDTVASCLPFFDCRCSL